jgi:DNA-directed RNA polymerase specialized sigma24 family protein
METKRDVGATYREYYIMVWGQALRVLGDESAADDVAQDVFVRYMKWRRRGETERSASAILFRMATSIALHRLRVARRSVTAPTETFATPPSTSPGHEVTLRHMLQRGGGVGGQVAVYYYLCGMNDDEIAGLMQMERRDVGRELERFRERARHVLEAGRGDA